MSLRINYNGAAENAWRNLGINDDKLSGSVQKLSSGLKINKGGDDPAGLIISERLKAQITGLGQAIQNASEATSLVQTAEGSLVEMNNMLNKMRGLAVHAANTGVVDADSIAADQRQVDSAIDSIQSIRNNTKYQQKKLLDGSAANSANVNLVEAPLTELTTPDVKGAVDTIGSALTLTLSTAAERAYVSSAAALSATHLGGFLYIQTDKMSQAKEIKIDAQSSAATIANTVNTYYEQTGVFAATSAGALTFTYSGYGEKSSLTVSSDVASVIANELAESSRFERGVDAIATLQYNTTNGGAQQTITLAADGLDLSVTSSNNVEAQLIGTKISVIGAGAAVSGVGTGAGGNTLGNVWTEFASIEADALQFSLGQDAATTEIREVSIRDMDTAKLGVRSDLVGSSLDAIKTGGTFALATNAKDAVKIIDQAIDDVSKARADLGAFQMNVLEVTSRSLAINKENLAASNSRIADVDMALEMMSFTKSQILTQAGTAMLAQANQLPQSVLQLLK
jgi:flagellin